MELWVGDSIHGIDLSPSFVGIVISISAIIVDEGYIGLYKVA